METAKHCSDFSDSQIFEMEIYKVVKSLIRTYKIK